MKILITGASGFIGAHLLAQAIEAAERDPDVTIRLTGRSEHLSVHAMPVKVRGKIPGPAQSAALDYVQVADYEDTPDWSTAVADCDVVIHAAACPHPLKGQAGTERLFKINRDATVSLASAAAQAGVKRFVFISTVKVWGKERDAPYGMQDAPDPTDAYGLSKWQAEQALHTVTKSDPMELVILRPAMVFGAGDNGNFARLVSLIHHHLPLPLASVRNRRSMIWVDDLARIILAVSRHPSLSQTTYLVSHRQALSTPALLRAIARGLDQSPRLFPFPPNLLFRIARLLGLASIAGRLLGSYHMDSTPLYNELGLSESADLEDQITQLVRTTD